VLAARRAEQLVTTAAAVEACTALVTTAAEAFGRIDVLINNAGLEQQSRR
jgi:NAD(P)-dependent dehydrogenase (short-subunit alcohol dehydrogenase family)